MNDERTDGNLITYRYGHCSGGEGLRLGAARHLPRGVRKDDYARRGYFDLWIPILAPGKELVAKYRHHEITFAAFSRAYRREMSKPEPRGAIELVARLSGFQRIGIGCFCEDPSHCHRTVLWELIDAARERLTEESHARAKGGSPFGRYASPACYLADFEEEESEGGSGSSSSSDS